MKSTLHGFVWPAGILALKFVGATNPVLLAGNVVGAAYTFKDIPEIVYNYCTKKEDTVTNENAFDHKKGNVFLTSI